jgi:MFS family permease
VLRAWFGRDNERLSIWNGCFATVSMSIVNNFVAMYLLDALHATNDEMGLLNSLPSLVNLFAMLAAAVMIGRTRSKKRFCAIATTVSRSFYVWIALVPLLPIGDPALWVVWLVALTRVPQSFGDLSWQALMGDIIDPERRSVFFSERNRAMTIVGLLVTFGTGLVLQQFDKHLQWPYQIAFIATVLFSFMEILLLLWHDEPAAPADNQVSVIVKGVRNIRGQAIKDMIRNRAFLWVVGALLFFNFAWQMSWPLFNIYQIRTAHAPAFWLGMITVANQLGQILTFRWWGRMEERYGTGKMMAWAAIGMGLAPVLTIMSTNMVYLCIVNLFTGIPLAGTLLLLFNYLLEVSPTEHRTTYIAYYNVALSVVGFIAPEVGIWLLNTFNMDVGMMTSTVLRILGGILFFYTASRGIRKIVNPRRIASL